MFTYVKIRCQERYDLREKENGRERADRGGEVWQDRSKRMSLTRKGADNICSEIRVMIADWVQDWSISMVEFSKSQLSTQTRLRHALCL
jgi:hypothetical protein